MEEEQCHTPYEEVCEQEVWVQVEEQSCVNKVNTDIQTTKCVESEARLVIIDEVVFTNLSCAV